MTDALATRSANGHVPDAAVMEQVLVGGDLGKLTPAQRVDYYSALCTSLSLNPLSQPFRYLRLQGHAGPLTLYATKVATEQLRTLHHVSITRLEAVLGDDGILEVTATATLPDGRTDQDTGAVSVAGLRGEALANARMKARTKAKRRVTLSIVGLGWLDESEVEHIPDARRVRVDATTGEIAEAAADTPTARPALPAGKRWSRAQLNWFWSQLSELKPRVTGDELHAILSDAAGEPVASIHDAPDLDLALWLVFKARQGERVVEGAPTLGAEEAVSDAPLEHPEGSVEHAWARYTALAALAARWNRDYPEQAIRWADPPRDAPALQVDAYADGLERRLAKLGYGVEAVA